MKLFEDVDYQIRDDMFDNYTMSKWTHGKEPKEVYNIKKKGNGWSCSCPLLKSCKHITMLKNWISEGKHSFWNM